MGEIHRFLSFYAKIGENSWRITLKNVKILLKNLFLRNFGHLSL